jgi:hypothetical protein
MNYKPRYLDDANLVTSDKEPIENRRHNVSEFMEKLDLDVEISYCKDKLKEISMEYNSTMICEWPTLREMELYFYRELSRLHKLKKDKEAAIELSENKNNMIILVENKLEKINDKERQSNGDEQWDINEKILLDSFEEEEEEEEFINEAIKEIFDYDASEQLNDIINSLDDEGMHNLENATEAMEVDFAKIKRVRYGKSSIKNEGEMERPSRVSGNWPPEKNNYPYNYIPGQYAYMGTKRREFEKSIKFQNHKSDGAILNLVAHDPIDWPNIISIWKGLIVQKYI